MANPGSHKYLFVAVAFALTLVNVDLFNARAQTQSAPQPAKVREVDFTYHTEITGIDPKAPSCRGLDSAAARRPIPAGKRVLGSTVRRMSRW